MNTPDTPQIRELCEEIENTSFKVKMRGYDPEEVDSCMDEIVERLKAMENIITETKRYETWLREELHVQVVNRAQQEARQIMQEAQDRARAFTDAARADIAREQAEARERIRKESADWTNKKATLERELADLHQRTDEYRAQSVRALKEGLDLLEQIQKKEQTQATPMPPLDPIPPQAPLYRDPTPYSQPLSYPDRPHPETEINSVDDIDRMMEAIRREMK